MFSLYAKSLSVQTAKNQTIIIPAMNRSNIFLVLHYRKLIYNENVFFFVLLSSFPEKQKRGRSERNGNGGQLSDQE